jgi:hypothetical protein
MIGLMKAVVAATAISLSTAWAVPAAAQSPSVPTWQDGVSQHHRTQYRIMKDMTDEMGRMTEQMSHGELTSEQRQQMASRMGAMSDMMRRMSGLASQPAMTEAEQQKQMDQMRKQMDEMTREGRTQPRG